ncbi:FadR/GntR family transcriptional regulator [Candidatus Solirubrobacter pratensis]|uniref:FadR/GntR family transcriptional regulator n=1 Tax=Candidatus Solirubrobacter pratensis TaxID=1298857 RepID=UPI000409896A|nr:FadR/GntR family transcriptional regulator [Candidatus Solirubrobacter pratensis]
MAEFVDEIVTGRLAPGDVLAREVEVADRFGISRGVARECVRGLEERGLVTVRHGSDTTVNPREKWDLFDEYVLSAALGGAAAVESLGAYLECRRIIEVEAAGLAAERCAPEHVAALEARFAAMVDATRERDRRRREQRFHEADVAFHVALIEGTGNPPLVLLVRRIYTALMAARFPLARPAYRRTRALPEHAAILAAVRAGDPQAARDAMRTHLMTVEPYLHEHARRVARGA